LKRLTTMVGIALMCAAPACGLGDFFVSSDNTSSDNQSGGGPECDDGETKVVLCHIPPGNPENAHTIEVGESAVPAHLEHGDTLGACQGDTGGGDKVTICHIPPGNPENAHSITISVNALDAHLEHGDSIGACQEPPPECPNPNDDVKVKICHIPPGNPEGAHTIEVSVSAVPAHLEHGDTLGECPDGGDEEPRCGDGVKDEGEECDGGDFGNVCCDNFGFPASGILICTPNCTIDTSECVPPNK
jgi:hypothetical protein